MLIFPTLWYIYIWHTVLRIRAICSGTDHSTGNYAPSLLFAIRVWVSYVPFKIFPSRAEGDEANSLTSLANDLEHTGSMILPIILRPWFVVQIILHKQGSYFNTLVCGSKHSPQTRKLSLTCNCNMNQQRPFRHEFLFESSIRHHERLYKTKRLKTKPSEAVFEGNNPQNSFCNSPLTGEQSWLQEE